jgi:8-amino-7-oxononanoate synthase
MLLDKFSDMAAIQAGLAERGIRPFGAVTESIGSATRGVVEGREVILAGTNNYLGLSHDPRCIEAACEGARQWGTGTTGSRMANGTFTAHLDLESELADLYGLSHAIVFTTGYAATQGMCATLAGPGDTILMDADSHASIYAGVQLSGARVLRFKHNNPEDLARRLRRLGDQAANTLIVTEGIYSMLGDVAPLQEIAAVKREYGSMLLVDEAHSLGVMGEQGKGAAAAAGVEEDVDFFVGTFSKSLGATGGFCVSRHEALEAIRFSVRSYIFTASASPPVIESTRRALAIMRTEPRLQERLWENANRLYQALDEMGLDLGPMVSPVVAVTLNDREKALACWQQLLESGVYVNLVVPPASPTGNSLLRCSVSAAHSPEEIDALIDAFGSLRGILGQA